MFAHRVKKEDGEDVFGAKSTHRRYMFVESSKFTECFVKGLFICEFDFKPL